jgi:hypothetical protein
METTKIGDMKVQDAMSGENCYIVVNTTRDGIGIAISQEENGDAEVFLKVHECQNLIAWLQAAIQKVS